MLLIGKKLYAKADLNRAIIFNIATRIVQSVGGILTLILITRFLNKNEQGYYYTFASFLSIQIFFELGLTSVLTQYIAHEAAHLRWKNKDQLFGDEYYQSRLASLIRLGVKWFSVLAVLLFIVLYLSGKFFFSRYNNSLAIEWQDAWFVLSVSTAFLLVLNFSLAILEGIGKIEEVNKLRLVQQSLNLFLITLFFVTGLKLLSGGLALLLSNVFTGLILLVVYRNLFKSLLKINVTSRVDYKKEILPFLSKIALGNMSGYFIYQIINPVLFATQGPVVAGQMGATQTFLNGIVVVSSSWLSTKIATFSNFVSLRKYRILNVVYRRSFIISFVVCLAGVITFVIAISVLQRYFPNLGSRFLGFFPTIFLALTQLATLIGNSQSYYLRSFKKEPFFIPSIVIGVLSGISTILCCKFAGIDEMTFAYFIINGIVGFLWGCVIFRNKTFQWTNKRLWI